MDKSIKSYGNQMKGSSTKVSNNPAAAIKTKTLASSQSAFSMRAPSFVFSGPSLFFEKQSQNVSEKIQDRIYRLSKETPVATFTDTDALMDWLDKN